MHYYGPMYAQPPHIQQFVEDYLKTPERESGSGWIRKGMVAWGEQGGICAHCQVPIAFDDFHIDHILPLSRGGSNGQANLQALCAPCNLRKGNRPSVDDGWGEVAGFYFLRWWYIKYRQPGWPAWYDFYSGAYANPQATYRWLIQCQFFAHPRLTVDQLIAA